jgi:hypothetical protein
MTLTETLNIIDSYLDIPESSLKLKQSKKQIISLVQLIKSHITSLEKDEEVVVTQENHKLVKECLNILNILILEQEITQDFSNFVSNLMLLASNWNKNTDKIDYYETDFNLLNRLVQSHLTILEAINIIKYLKDQVQSLQHMNFASVELSKHYLDSFDKK